MDDSKRREREVLRTLQRLGINKSVNGIAPKFLCAKGLPAGTCADEAVQIYRPLGKVSEHLERGQSHSTAQARLNLIGRKLSPRDCTGKRLPGV